MARVLVYVDGFNLYYRALKGEVGVKWLNIEALTAQMLRSKNRVEKVGYFTARISGKDDPDAPRRQHAYLSALEHHPIYALHYGTFLSKKVYRPLVDPPPDGPKTVQVQHFEEKGSDVSLAIHLLNDGWKDAYDAAVVITNDSDLVEPIRVARAELGKPIGVLCPSERCTQALKDVASFVRYIRRSHLIAAQFPEVIPGTTIRRPEGW
ncbi:MAG: NYN domain-containing protein [Deltaproteobacteria bacterium]|nr:NYN domain-containing protein [Deltaproteobacteria bacterium]